jgi:hypothetical protein
MIIVRDVFQLRFGAAREALAICKEGLEQSNALGSGAPMRFMTDLVGDYYTLVMESTFESLAQYEEMMEKIFALEAWRAWYQKLLPLLVSGRREIFRLAA